MKTIFRITVIFNMLLGVLAFICASTAAINKSGDFFAWSALSALASIYLTAMMLPLYNGFKEADKKELRRHKRKRCLAMSRQLELEMYEAWRQDDAVWGLHAKKWSDKWLNLADKFTE